MNEREPIALEDLCTTLHKEVADLEKERRELQEKVADRRELQEELDGRDEAETAMEPRGSTLEGHSPEILRRTS
jgi:phage shock protein A